MDTIPNNFLGLEEKHSTYETARFVVLPIPYDATASYRGGCRAGPAAVIEASGQVEWFDEEELKYLRRFAEEEVKKQLEALLGVVAVKVS